MHIDIDVDGNVAARSGWRRWGIGWLLRLEDSRRLQDWLRRRRLP